MSVNKHRTAMSRHADRAVFDMKDLVSATEALLRSTASYTGTEIEEARSRLARQLASAREEAGQWNRQAKQQYRQVLNTTDDYVQDHPWRVVGLAAIIGLLAGLCACNGRRER